MNAHQWVLKFQLEQSVKMGAFGSKLVYRGFEKDVEEAGQGNNFASCTLFGNVLYYDFQRDSDGKDSIVLKILEKVDGRPFVFVEFQNEISFYSRILPYLAELDDAGRVRDLFPRYYYSSCSVIPGENFAVTILENLKRDGYRLSEQRFFLDFQHLALMMKSLGKFHGCSYLASGAAQTDGKQRQHYFQTLVKSCIAEAHWTQTTPMEHIVEGGYLIGIKPLLSDPKYRDRLSGVLEFVSAPQKFIRDAFTEYDRSIAVLCHGDFLRNNVLFKYDETTGTPVDVKIIDFGFVRYSSPVVDLALVLYLNTSQEMRDKYWDNLLSIYYESLCSSFPKYRPCLAVPSLQRLTRDFRIKSFYVYLIATIFYPMTLCALHNVPVTYGSDDPKINLSHYDFLQDFCTKTLSDIVKDMVDRGFV